MPPEAPVLAVRDIRVSYGPIAAIRRCAIEVRSGETVAVVGANGAGKTTLLRAASGLLPLLQGDILFCDRSIRRRPTHVLAHDGLLHLPEGRGVLPSLSVWENMRIAWEIRPSPTRFDAALDQVFARFPRLAERRDQRAGTLSGGEQQMLALARAIVNPPRLLLLDEPSLGLSPVMVAEAYRALRAFQASGMTILLVEQNVHAALKLAHRGYVLQQGEIVMAGAAAELLAHPDMLSNYLGSQ